MADETAKTLTKWLDSAADKCYFCYTTNPAFRDHSLNVLAINADTETLVEAKSVPTLKNAKQWVNDMEVYWRQFDYDEKSDISSPKRPNSN
ncbi:BPG_G0000820.mRNA.1.CDS.1 [Saccharomyces cerevisiae]|nr:BPG_G0000820.mRNA.1.CDS.1 [Saccharomyces cerevisiae]CAI7036112.1 BPG_G0000820.mRNA.1.CDS.1 [Saccharomyces cerevisiae]